VLIVLRPHEPEPQQALLEHLPAEPHVVVGEVLHRPSHGQGRGDDGTGGRAGDQVEVVAEPEVGTPAVALAEELLDLRQEAQGENAPESSTVEGQDALRPAVGPVWSWRGVA